LSNLATIRFLRVRNREGCDVYLHPYAEDRNAGYILIDLDQADPVVLSAMCANGHEPCVVLQTRRPLKSGGWALNLLIVQAGAGLNPF